MSFSWAVPRHATPRHASASASASAVQQSEVFVCFVWLSSSSSLSFSLSLSLSFSLFVVGGGLVGTLIYVNTRNGERAGKGRRKGGREGL